MNKPCTTSLTDCEEHTYLYTHEGNTWHTVYHYKRNDCPYCELATLRGELSETHAEQHHDYMSIVDDYAHLEHRYNLRVKSHRQLIKMYVRTRKERDAAHAAGRRDAVEEIEKMVQKMIIDLPCRCKHCEGRVFQAVNIRDAIRAEFGGKDNG